MLGCAGSRATFEGEAAMNKTKDLAERLRLAGPPLCNEAADEIEKLKSRVAELESVAREVTGGHEKCTCTPCLDGMRKERRLKETLEETR